jgi:hypothetical protein
MSANPGPERGQDGRSPPKRQIFRDEALARRLRAREFGDVLRLPPWWTRLAYPLVVAVALAAVALLGLGKVRDYARGPAVVRAEDGRFTVVALLPPPYLPELRAGLPLVVSIAGFPRARADLEITLAGDHVISAVEARRALGDAAGSIEIPEAAVLVEASVPKTTFEYLGGEASFHDGMAAEAETPVGSQRLIFSLFPGLKTALRK